MLLSTGLEPPSPMSEEQLSAFLEKVKADTSLQEKLNGAADADAVVEIAKSTGFLILAKDIQWMQPKSQELSDEELEAAVGGGPRGVGCVSCEAWCGGNQRVSCGWTVR